MTIKDAIEDLTHQCYLARQYTKRPDGSPMESTLAAVARTTADKAEILMKLLQKEREAEKVDPASHLLKFMFVTTYHLNRLSRLPPEQWGESGELESELLEALNQK